MASPRMAARPGERGIHRVQLIELALQHVQLLQRIVQKIGLDPEILQHLLKLADFLGNVLGVHRGHTLCRDRSGDIEGKRESDATGEKGNGAGAGSTQVLLTKIHVLPLGSLRCRQGDLLGAEWLGSGGLDPGPDCDQPAPVRPGHRC